MHPGVPQEGRDRFHVPCPGGHVHPAREAWIGRRMICPECDAPFVVRRTDSLEYRARERRSREEAEARRAGIWLGRAVAAAVLVLSGLVGLVVASLDPRWLHPAG